MFIEERHQKIIELLNQQGRIEVQELSTFFSISEDSIRRDLRIMEEKGHLKRTYGGAILPKKVSSTASLTYRENLDIEKKEEIAQLAFPYINENDTILLDGSTTVEKLVPHIKKFNNLTIITNSIPIAYMLLDVHDGIKVFFLGGIVKKDIGNTISIETYEMIKLLNVDKVFMGVCAISIKSGLTTPVIKEGLLKRAMIESGREIYFMIDSSKFGAKYLYKIGELKPDYKIITDSNISNETLNDFSDLIKQGLKIIYYKK